MDVQIKDKDDVMFLYDVKVLDQEKISSDEYKITISNKLCKIIIKTKHSLIFSSDNISIENFEYIKYIDLYKSISEAITLLDDISDHIYDIRYSLENNIDERLKEIKYAIDNIE